MKSLSIAISLFFGFVCLFLIVWIGRYQAALPISNSVAVKQSVSTTDSSELPVPSSGPFGKAEVTETQYRMVESYVGDELGHTFQIKNVGQGPLTVKLPGTSQEFIIGDLVCDNGKVANDGIVAPGQTLNIPVHWKLAAKPPQIMYVIPVATNDPDLRKIEFRISGAVNPSFVVTPASIWQVGEVSEKKPSTALGHVLSKRVSDFELLDDSAVSHHSKITWEPADAESLAKFGAKSGFRIMVEAGREMPFGTFRERIQLKAVTKTHEELIEFGVMGTRPETIELRDVAGAAFNSSTKQLFLGDFPANKGKTARAKFFFTDWDGEVVLSSIEPASAGVKVVFAEQGEVQGASRVYQVVFEVPPGTPADHHRDNAEVLILHFNHPSSPDLKLTIDYHAK